MVQPIEEQHTFCQVESRSWREYQELLSAFAAEAKPLYLVGGAVRDLWLSQTRGRPFAVADLDILTPTDALQISRRVADRIGWAYYALDPVRDVARLVKQVHGRQLICDVATPRGNSLESDLRLRDFTVNAMALAIDEASLAHATADVLQGHLLDPLHGRADLESGLIRTVSAQSLADDPVRLIRAVRLASQFGFTLTQETHRQIEQLAHLVTTCSAERIRDELWKALATPAPATVIRVLEQTGLLQWLLPEVITTKGVLQSEPHFLDVYEHTLLAVDHAARLRQWLLGAKQMDTLGEESATRPSERAAVLAWQSALAPWQMQLQDHFGRQISAERNRAQWLVWHALLHDVGKPATRSEEITANAQLRTRFFGHEDVGAQLVAGRLEALRFSRDEIELATVVVRAHMNPHWLHASFAEEPLSRRAMYRFSRKTGGLRSEAMPAIDAVILSLADYMAIHQGLNGASEQSALRQWRQFLKHIVQYLAFAFAEDGPRQIERQPLVNGHVLMSQLGLSPGPQLGRLLEQLAEAQAAGEVATAAEAVDWAKQLLRSPEWA